MPVVKNNGGDISYRVFGSGSRDLVLVHGWMVSGAVYDALVEALDLSKFRVIVPDFCSTGATKAPQREALGGYVDDLRAVVEDAGATSVVMVGNSMGGQIAQLYAATYPEQVESLVLLCSVPTSGMALPAEGHELFINSGENRELQRIILNMACTNLADAARERMLDDAASIPASGIRVAYTAWTGGDASTDLGTITARTLVVGTDDPFLPHDFLKAAVVDPIPNASFAYLAGCGHYPQVELAGETARVLEEFIAAG